MNPLGLQLILAPQLITLPSSPDPFSVSVGVTVHNAANTPVTFLNWGTPFDPQAGILGVFTVQDKASGETVPMDEIQISRKLPAAREDLVEVEANASRETVVNLPPLKLLDGHEYSITAQGRWHAVWNTSADDVTSAQLEELSGASRGEISSNTITVKVGCAE